MSVYELAILGSVTPDQFGTLKATLGALVSDFDLTLDADVRIHDAESLGDRDIHAAFAAVYFGGDASEGLDAVGELVDSSLPIIPVISAQGNFVSDIPHLVQFANGLTLTEDDPEMAELATAIAGVRRTAAPPAARFC